MLGANVTDSKPIAPWLKDLLLEHHPPCISLYQPLHRAGMNKAAPEDTRTTSEQIYDAGTGIEDELAANIARTLEIVRIGHTTAQREISLDGQSLPTAAWEHSL